MFSFLEPLTERYFGEPIMVLLLCFLEPLFLRCTFELVLHQLETHWSHSSFSARTIDSKIKDACKISSTNTKAARIESIWPHPHTAGFRWPLTFSLRIKILFPANRRKVYSTVQILTTHWLINTVSSSWYQAVNIIYQYSCCYIYCGMM